MGAKEIAKTMVLKDGVTGPLKKMSAGTVQYKKNLQELKDVGSRTWASMKDGLTSVATAAAAVGTALLGAAGIAGTFHLGLSTASDLESYRLTLETVLKDTKKAGDMMKWASQFANITPFDTTEVIEGTVRLQAYGINAQKTMGSIGDMASVMNKDLMQAIEAVADAQTGELERMKEFGITKAMIQKKSDEMFKNQAVINNKGQIVDQQRFNQALFALMDDRFKGGMEKQANTYKGLMSTISGTWATGMADIMGISAAGEIRAGSLFDTIKKAAKGAGDVVTELANNGSFQQIGDSLANMLQGAINTFNFFRDNWSYISPIIYGVGAALVYYGGALVAIKTYQLASAAAMWVMTTAQLGLNAAMRANPIGLVATLIGLLVVAGTYLVKNWEQVKLVGMNTWNVVVSAAEWAVNKYFDYANFMIRVYKFAWDSIEYAGISIWNGILTAGQAGVNGFIGLINDMIKKALDGINTLLGGANKVSKALGFGSVVDPISFGGLGKVDFSGAKGNAEKPKWDSNLTVLPKVDFGGAQFSDDSIMKQTKKAQNERDKKKAKSDEDLQKALNDTTAALADNTAATNGNTSATKSNTATLKENQSPMDIADSLLSRIERHLYAT